MKKEKDIDKLVDVAVLKSSGVYPSEERLSRGPVAVIECQQEIPCNPCETICPKGVIFVGDPITNLPKFINIDICSGCGLCVVACPGLAIFILDKNYSKKEAAVTIPYEMYPIPEKGEEVDALDRNGKKICRGKVVKIRNNKKFNNTSLVTISIYKKFADEVRFFKINKSERNQINKIH